MSLYLLSKDVKLRATINRQLRTGCISAQSVEQFKIIQEALLSDPHPVMLIDDNFADRDAVPLLDYIITTGMQGAKIFLTGRRNRPGNPEFVSDNHMGILIKPFTMDRLIRSVVKLAGVASIAPHLTDEQLDLVSDYLGSDWFASVLIGETEDMVRIRKIIRKIGPGFSSVHVNGETGTGKEVVASLLRNACGCADPYVVVNCSSIPQSLADAYIFGNEKGAYTDAKEKRNGMVKNANGGILFLDEIEDLAHEVQGKFLRLLETKEFTPLGSDNAEVSDFRLITASNKPLYELRDSGLLRFDLFNRLNRMTISIPPLRNRKEDIPLLIEHYLKGRNEERRPDRETMDRIMQYDWPGNVRELFNELEQLSAFAENSQVLSYSSVLTESVLKKRK